MARSDGNRVVISYPVPKMPKIFTYFKRRREAEERIRQSHYLPATEAAKIGWRLGSQCGQAYGVKLVVEPTIKETKVDAVPSTTPRKIKPLTAAEIHSYHVDLSRGTDRLTTFAIEPLLRAFPTRNRLRFERRAWAEFKRRVKYYRENPELLYYHAKNDVEQRYYAHQLRRDTAIFL